MSELATLADLSGLVEDRGMHAGYPPEIRELAFEVWMLRAGRNQSKTSRLLATEEYGELAVPQRTIADWSHRYDWAQLAADRLRRFAPLLRSTIEEKALALVDAGLDRITAAVLDPDTDIRDATAGVRLGAEVAGIIGRSANAQQVIVQTAPNPSPRLSGVPSADLDSLADAVGALVMSAVSE